VPTIRVTSTDGLGAVIAGARASCADAVEVKVEAATAEDAARAEAHGMALTREVLRLHRPLPVDEPWELDVRPFVVGRDEDAFLAVNNRAFAWHPDQGGWTRAEIEAGEAEPWFDPSGFLLHERDGQLVAFCWTKLHSPAVGEIYVIGVDPDRAGGGIGRAIVLAGLDHIAGRGRTEGILYVESTNTRARALYDRMGFTVEWADRFWTLTL
jgi:mycothiol synthase